MIIASKIVKKLIMQSIKSIPQFSTGDKKIENREDAVVQRKEEVQLMQDVYEKIQMKGLEQRQITGVNSFQKDILTQNKFDLLDPKIQPKIATLSTTVGLQIDKDSYLTEISLGKIKVKKENQIFLSQVDPYNIPEYYDIIFDYEKEMSLVGKKVQNSQQGQKQQSSEMKISTKKAFEQKSNEQIMKQIFGAEVYYTLNSRIIWKMLLFACIMGYFIYSPIILPIKDLINCLESIQQIEQQRIKQLNKIKKEAMINALINNQDMNIP